MSISRRDVCTVLGGSLALSAGAPSVASAATLRIVSVDLPARIERGGRFATSVTLGNAGSEPTTREVGYFFEDDVIATAEETIPPGETKRFRIPDMRFEWLETDRDRPVEPGTYTHSMRVRNGPQERRAVEIVDPGGASGGLRIASSRLPSTLRRGETAGVSVTVENTGKERATARVSYAFGDSEVFHKDVTVSAGGSETVGFPDLTVEDIEAAVGDRIDPGTYSHRLGIRGEPRVTTEVEVLDGTGGVTTGGTGRTGPARDDPTGEERGFFTNGGDAPAALSNVFNLTVAGFMLSVAGIVYQLLQGR